MISFPTQSWPTGITDEINRRTMVPVVSAGLVFQTIRKRGGTFLSARRRSRQAVGASAGFGTGGWCGIKFQCNASAGLCGSERGPEGPIRHHLPESEQAPRSRKGGVWENQVRRKRTRQNLFVIQMIGPRRLRVK